MPKVAKKCQKLPKTAKHCQKLPKAAKTQLGHGWTNGRTNKRRGRGASWVAVAAKTEDRQNRNKHTDVRNLSYVLHWRSVINWLRWLEVRTHVRPHVDNSTSRFGWSKSISAQTGNVTVKMYTKYKINLPVDSWPPKRKDMQLLTNQELYVLPQWRSAIN